ncbi:unnamed protein product [Urochloa decumbens]|uniref:DUF7054 domain-containing protein n=1 Tax=Urochloa decumbens TaxID=240449 RepID=A0ABC9F1S0_9POAL
MPPLAPPSSHGDKGGSGGQQRQETTAAGAAGALAARQRSASFHGRGAAEQRHQLQQKQRPKTLPDLLAGVRGTASFRSGSVSPPGETGGRRTPSKVLVSVAVQRSMWPLHVMAPAEWTVADLVAAAVALYVKEGRRPLLPSADPAAFSLHYSQFSLDSLDPKEKVMELGSRSFFLCPKSSAAGQTASSSSSHGVSEVSTVASEKAPAWLSYIQFWPMM